MKLKFTNKYKSQFKDHLLILLILTLSGFLFGTPFFENFFSFQKRERTLPDTIITQQKPPYDSVYNSLLIKAQSFYLAKSYNDALIEYEKALEIKPNDPKLKETIEKVKSFIAQQEIALQDYQKTIASGDNYFKVKDYLNAKSSYQYAIDLKPDDQYAKDKLKQTMELIRSGKAQNTLYDMAIASAEKLFQAKEYEKAKTEFEKARKILPEDNYAKERLNEIIKILVDRQSNEEMYTKSIAAADKFYNAKSYNNALMEYKNASSYKPEEKYPKDRITELAALIKSIKVRDDAYNKAIAVADNFFSGTSYNDAKKEYQNALTIKPDESYPKNKIKQINDILAGKQRTGEEYDRLVNMGDSLYIEKKFFAAKANYQQALKLKPGESYPKEMISKTDNMIAGQAGYEQVTEEAYQAAIKTADDLFTEKSYPKAKTEYQNALLIKPNENYPKTKVAEIDLIFAGLAKQKSLDDQYAGIITEADKRLAEKSYPEAKTGYQAALQIKPDQQYPKDKITEIDNTLAELSRQKGLDDQYTSAIAKADKLFTDKLLDQSKTEYIVAGNLRPNETYPKQKISEIDKLLADAAEQKVLDEKYLAMIANADKLLSAQNYANARTEYSNASSIKPPEQYPKDKIAEIDRITASIVDAKAKDEQFKSTINKADKLLAAKTYDQAKTEYQNALLIKPNENYPKTKVAEIDQIFAGLAKQKSLDDQYANLITEADKRLAEKSYPEAKTGYQAALEIKPDQQYPKDKITEIDNTLAELSRQKGLDDQYTSAIAKADKLFTDKLLDQSKAEYIIAGNLKPNETYPKQKIAEIDKLLADAVVQKVLDDKYQAMIVNADKLLSAQNYPNARVEYSNASSIKPSEQYPKDKIAEIDRITASIADAKAKDEQFKSTIDKADKLLLIKNYDQAKTEYQNALLIKPDETYPKTKVAEIDLLLAAITKQKALDDQYAGLITEADKKLAEKSFTEAKTVYQSALELKPDQQYPKGKITEIDKVLANLSRQKALDDQYDAVIAKADKLFIDSMLDESRTEFIAAGNLKPNETYPKQKISEIDKLKAEATQKKIVDDKYMAAILNADKLLSAQNYSNAKTEYSNASLIKPAEQYPKDKITEIESILSELKVKEEAYKAAITKADQLLFQKAYEEAKNEYTNASLIKSSEQYPKNKITEINGILMQLKGKKQTYDDLVLKGDDFFNQKDYYRSKDNFQQASDIFPEETYPKQKLNRINSVIDSIYRANKGRYDKAVADGDKSYNNLIYDKALDLYGEALSYLPMEKYPRDMINKIKRAIAENAIVDIVKTAIVIPEGTEKQLPFEPVNIASRKNNYLYIKIKNLSNKPFNILVRYGKDKQTNGGAVIRNLQADGNIYDRLISVRDQDPWYREDNNWIALLPQGGDVEVSFIQISRVAQ